MDNLELSNISVLDESICNAIGMNDNLEYSNLINESLLDGLTENTSLLNANGYSNLINESLLDGLTENTSLLNANGYSNSSGTTSGSGTKSGSGAGSYITPETITAATQLTTSIINATSPKQEGNCLKPSLPDWLQPNEWRSYNQCKENERENEQRRLEAERQRTEQERLRLEQARVAAKAQVPESDKILGMSKGVAIGIGVGALVLAIGGIIIYAKFKK